MTTKALRFSKINPKLRLVTTPTRLQAVVDLLPRHEKARRIEELQEKVIQSQRDHLNAYKKLLKFAQQFSKDQNKIREIIGLAQALIQSQDGLLETETRLLEAQKNLNESNTRLRSLQRDESRLLQKR